MFRGYGNTGKICEVVEEVKLKALCSTSEKKKKKKTDEHTTEISFIRRMS